ncbi:MAG: PilZ domain-containing protein [Deltaproteobacteria bacterium]|nr:PilZ domain-containing protein [Deltaproteobacteria bacterium]
MLRILTLDEPRLIAALRGGYFRRAHGQITAAAGIDELLERVAAVQPHLVFVVDRGAPAGHRRDIAVEVRSRTTGRAPLVLLAAAEDALPAEDSHQYDAVVSLEDPAPDLVAVVASATDVPPRRRPRLPVTIPALLLAPGGPGIEGVAVDLSHAGAGLLLSRTMSACDRAFVLFHRRDGRRVSLQVEPIWQRASAAASARVGVRFYAATPRDIRAVYDLAFWRIVTCGSDRVIYLQGELNAGTSFSGVLEHVTSVRFLDLGAIAGADTTGLRGWLDFVRRLPPRPPLLLRRVPGALATRLVPEPSTSFRCVIESLLVRYECLRCGAEVDAEQAPEARPPAPTCRDCGGELEAVGAPLEGARRC